MVKPGIENTGCESVWGVYIDIQRSRGRYFRNGTSHLPVLVDFLCLFAFSMAMMFLGAYAFEKSRNL